MTLDTLQKRRKITLITPIYNEQESIPLFYNAIQETTHALPYDFDLLFVNDGSRDASARRIEVLMQKDERVKYIEFSRNFGKEAATTAGLHAAEGDAAILIDADLQHPPELIPTFIERWEQGAQIVVGVRAESKSDSSIKRLGSGAFNWLMNSISETRLIPHATDYRLLDRSVIREFKRFTEHERLTRGLIDWLGFRRVTVPFYAHERVRGTAQYSVKKLFRLAISSIVGHSLLPLRLVGILGAIITPCAFVLGVVMFIDHYITSLGFNFSGPAILADIILFLVGIILICIGLLAVYIGQIFQETQNRPMYVISKKRHL